MNAQEIAAKLTKGQREALAHLAEKPRSMPIRWSQMFGYDLEQIGLAKRT